MVPPTQTCATPDVKRCHIMHISSPIPSPKLEWNESGFCSTVGGNQAHNGGITKAMVAILPFLLCLQSEVSMTTIRQFSRIALAMLTMRRFLHIPPKRCMKRDRVRLVLPPMMHAILSACLSSMLAHVVCLRTCTLCTCPSRESQHMSRKVMLTASSGFEVPNTRTRRTFLD